MHRCQPLVLAAFAAVASFITLTADAQQPIVIKFSHVVAVDTPKGKAAERFRQLVEERSKGAVRIEVYPNSQLYKDGEEMNAIQLGAVQLLAPSLAKFGPLGVREYEAFDLPYIFPDKAVLQTAANIGKLKITNVLGWHIAPDSTKIYDKLYSFGGRSFSIRDSAGRLLWDSGDQFEQIEKDNLPVIGFNVSHDANTREGRSPSKGPEPEGAAIGKAYGRTYAFIGLERVGGIMMYDISDPAAPQFTDYLNNRDFTKAVTADAAGDLGPEGLVFISEENSPNGKPLVVVAHELSGTTTIFELKKNK